MPASKLRAVRRELLQHMRHGLINLLGKLCTGGAKEWTRGNRDGCPAPPARWKNGTSKAANGWKRQNTLVEPRDEFVLLSFPDRWKRKSGTRGAATLTSPIASSVMDRA